MACVPLRAQNAIIYSFEQPVSDSLMKGIKWYETSYKQKLGQIKIFALITEDPGTVQIVLVEYSKLNLNGIQALVDRTNRKLRVSDGIFLPILFRSDEYSEEFKRDHIQDLPYGGFSILVQYESQKIKSIETSEKF